MRAESKLGIPTKAAKSGRFRLRLVAKSGVAELTKKSFVVKKVPDGTPTRMLDEVVSQFSGPMDLIETKAPKSDITTMRVRRSTLAQLEERKRELGAASLDEALATTLFRQRSYEAIARLKANPAELADYQADAQGWAEIDVEVHE